MDTKILHWNYLNFKHIPMELILYKNLEEVYLKENHILEIPNWLCDLKSLRFIHLAGNELNSLPEECYLMESLMFLDVSRNQIDKLPATVGLMFELTQLNASANFLTDLPREIGNLQKLELLNVARNQLKRLPIQLSFCSKLKELNLSENSQIWHLPERIASLSSLERLFLDGCSLIYLPANLQTYLKVVRVFQNKSITHIPICYEKFYRTSYEVQQKNKKPMIVSHSDFFWVKESETNFKLLLPFGTRKIFNVSSMKTLISLYDVCLHTIESHAQLKSIYKENPFNITLPERYMLNHIHNGPIARCNNTKCGSPLYTEYYFMLVKRRYSQSRQLFSCYFCSQYCANYWSNENWKIYYHIEWQVVDKTESLPEKLNKIPKK